MSRCLFLLMASAVALATIHPTAQPNTLFAFHSNPLGGTTKVAAKLIDV